MPACGKRGCEPSHPSTSFRDQTNNRRALPRYFFGLGEPAQRADGCAGSHHNHEEGERHGWGMSMLRRRKGRSQSPRAGREPGRKGPRWARGKATTFLWATGRQSWIRARSIAQLRAGPLHNKKIRLGLLLFQMCNNCISRTFAVLPGATDGSPIGLIDSFAGKPENAIYRLGQCLARL